MRRSMFARAFLVACLFGVTGCGDDSKGGGKGGNKAGFEAKPLDAPLPPGGGGADPNKKGGGAPAGAPGGTPGVG